MVHSVPYLIRHFDL